MHPQNLSFSKAKQGSFVCYCLVNPGPILVNYGQFS